MFTRIHQNTILQALQPNFVVVLYGARRTGKTVLLHSVREAIGHEQVLMVNGEDLEVARLLSSQKLSILERFVAGYTYLFIDEAQSIPGIGLNLKLMVDMIPGLHILITGSSALELYGTAGEPLTGRSLFLSLFPLAQMELGEHMLEMERNLEDRLIFGWYPQVVTAENEQKKIEVLQSIKNGYLLKDVLALDNLKGALFVLDLLRLIAFQIGMDISYSELAKQLGVNVRTVQRYLDILEKTFVIFSLRGYSKNLRKEISKSPRYYFWDNGIRNTIILAYNDLKNRNDIGRLWENFCISERMKWQQYKRLYYNNYFWRTYDQQEIDLIEEYSDALHAFEFKWTDKKTKVPMAFRQAYTDFTFDIITRENYYDFIGV
ncbi:MAG: ATP-binding protein [Cyclobacteriaceae bacterium]|nr:ATP-binding protein [Cyclobacteriaceae bacterium]